MVYRLFETSSEKNPKFINLVKVCELFDYDYKVVKSNIGSHTVNVYDENGRKITSEGYSYIDNDDLSRILCKEDRRKYKKILREKFLSAAIVVDDYPYEEEYEEEVL